MLPDLTVKPGARSSAARAAASPGDRRPMWLGSAGAAIVASGVAMGVFSRDAGDVASAGIAIASGVGFLGCAWQWRQWNKERRQQPVQAREHTVLRALMENTGLAVIACDSQGVVREFSLTAER